MILETTGGNVTVAAKPRVPWSSFPSIPTDTLAKQAVTPSSALALTAVLGAVSMIADANGIMPLEVIDTRAKSGRRVVSGGWLPAMLMHEPNDDMSGVDLWTFVQACLLLRGNAYLAKLPMPGGTYQLYPMLPDIVTPYRGASGEKVFRVRSYSGLDHVDEDFTPDAILHIKGRSLTDPLVGSSTIQCARHALGTQLAQQEYQARAYSDGQLIKGILSTPERNITVDAADRIKQQWKSTYGGTGNSHDVAILHSGMQFQGVSLSPEDAQFIQTMRWGHTQVATMFKIPASRLNGEGASLTYSNQGQDDLFFDKQACLPLRVVVEAALNRDRTLFGAYSAWTPRFNPEIVLRADVTTRVDVYQKMRAMGAVSVNEIRRFEDWADIGPEGDDFTPLSNTPQPPKGAPGARAVEREHELRVAEAGRQVLALPAAEVRVDVAPSPAPNVTVEAAAAPDVHVTVEAPEVRFDQPAPIVTVNVPEQPAPTVQVDVAAPNVQVDVAAPNVQVEPRIEVTAPASKAVSFTRDSRGLISGASVQEQ